MLSLPVVVILSLSVCLRLTQSATNYDCKDVSDFPNCFKICESNQDNECAPGTQWICDHFWDTFTLNCNSENSCHNITIYSSAQRTTINCNAPNACNGLTLYCGPSTPPLGYEISDFDNNITECVVNILHPNSFLQGSVKCDAVNPQYLKECTINIYHDTGELLQSSLECTSNVQDCSINCFNEQQCRFGTYICAANTCLTQFVPPTTQIPTKYPSHNPTFFPTLNPTSNPTASPSAITTLHPLTNKPVSILTTRLPTQEPITRQSSLMPVTYQPTTHQPSSAPTINSIHLTVPSYNTSKFKNIQTETTFSENRFANGSNDIYRNYTNYEDNADPKTFPLALDISNAYLYMLSVGVLSICLCCCSVCLIYVIYHMKTQKLHQMISEIDLKINEKVDHIDLIENIMLQDRVLRKKRKKRRKRKKHKNNDIEINVDIRDSHDKIEGIGNTLGDNYMDATIQQAIVELRDCDKTDNETRDGSYDTTDNDDHLPAYLD